MLHYQKTVFFKWVIFIFWISYFHGYSQHGYLADRWEQKISGYEELNPIEEDEVHEFLAYDYSSIFSNLDALDGHCFTTYVGVFGRNNSKIEFHLRASKYNDTKYVVTGVSKLGANVRPLKGFFKVKNFYDTGRGIYFMTFEYNLREPGDRDGDGYFEGIGNIVFSEGQQESVKLFWASSGDLREFNNVFVGLWKKYKENAVRKCIFSFSPTGIDAKLPFKAHLYKEFEKDDECRCSYEFKDEYKKYGWNDYNQYNKDPWWANYSLDGW